MYVNTFTCKQSLLCTALYKHKHKHFSHKIDGFFHSKCSSRLLTYSNVCKNHLLCMFELFCRFSTALLRCYACYSLLPFSPERHNCLLGRRWRLVSVKWLLLFHCLAELTDPGQCREAVMGLFYWHR